MGILFCLDTKWQKYIAASEIVIPFDFLLKASKNELCFLILALQKLTLNQ